MSVQNELLGLERKLWSGGAQEYLKTVDTECLVAFTSIAGVSSREEIAKTVGSAPRWENLEFEVKGVLTPSDEVAVLTYLASATRGEDESYNALVSSAYMRRADGWKLVFHQQTPLEESR